MKIVKLPFSRPLACCSTIYFPFCSTSIYIQQQIAVNSNCLFFAGLRSSRASSKAEQHVMPIIGCSAVKSHHARSLLKNGRTEKISWMKFEPPPPRKLFLGHYQPPLSREGLHIGEFGPGFYRGANANNERERASASFSVTSLVISKFPFCRPSIR